MNDLQYKTDKLLNLEARYVLIKEKGVWKGDRTRFTVVRRQYVMETLIWLQKNNPLYKCIEISEDAISELPEDGCFARGNHNDEESKDQK